MRSGVPRFNLMVQRILEDGKLTEFDVVVVGGGPAGSACAAELARGGCVTALVDADSSPHGWAGESLPRVRRRW